MVKRWLKKSRLLGIAAVILVAWLAIIPIYVVEAATTATVTITATGYVCEAPGGFTVTYISDYEVGLSWAKGAGADNTMVRACIGRQPEDRDDGYLVYYGENNYATDWVNLDVLDAKVHYRAWSESGSGIWEDTGSTGFIEGIGMKLIAFIVLALGLMITGYHFKKQALMMASGLSWVGFGLYMLSQATAWDIYRLFAYLGIALAIACFLETWLIGRKAGAEEEAREEVDEYIDEYDQTLNQIRKLRTLGARRK